jgi:hypothetical protein
VDKDGCHQGRGPGGAGWLAAALSPSGVPGPPSPSRGSGSRLGWMMYFLSVTPVGQQRTANTFFMILGSSVQSRFRAERLGGGEGQVMSQLFRSSLGKRDRFCMDLGIPE